MKLKKINGNIAFEGLIGVKIELMDRTVIATSYVNEENVLYVGEFFQNKTGQTTRIPLLDVENALKILSILGYEIEIVEGFSFSPSTVIKAQGLTQAGFSKLILQDGNYSVDGMFQQNFLTQEELEYLLNEGVEEMFLSDIK